MARTGGVTAVAVSPFDEAVLGSLESAARAENVSAYVKVAAAARLWTACVVADVEHGVPDRRVGNAAFAEIAARLTMSKTMAEKFATVGCDLRDRLPSVAAAFACGDIDFPRVRTIACETAGLSEATLAMVLPAALDAARTRSPGPLQSEIDRLISVADPDAHAERHCDASDQVEITCTRDIAGLVTVRAHTTPAVGLALMERLRHIADTPCAADPRGYQHRLHDALAALTVGENSLTCTCDRPECPRAVQCPAPLAPSTLVRVHVDAATLLGLTSTPPYLEGYGILPAEVARSLADDARWQAIVNDAQDTLASAGSLTAFRYRPPTSLADWVRARDGHCRFPDCEVPALRCQLDHVVPYDHADPARGGATTVDNLHCLCAFHHNLKTLGYWTPELLSNGAVVWTSLSGLRRTTVPALLPVAPRPPSRRRGRRTTPTLDQGDDDCPY